MIQQVIDSLLTTEHALSLVSNPDDILHVEQLLARLTDKGFKIVHERDVGALRTEIQRLRSDSGRFALSATLIHFGKPCYS